MFFHILSKRTRLWLPILLAGMSVLPGCLADTNPVVQVVPRVVLAPQNPRFSAPVSEYIHGSSPASGSMLVVWNRSIADTQLNFKGYFVKLWTSHVDTQKNNYLDDSIASAYVLRTSAVIPDTFYTFTQTSKGPHLPLGEYTVVVYGIKADSMSSLSSDSSVGYGLFDPLPFSNPSNLMAESAGSTQIKLHWTPSPQESDTGFYQYVIYYRDTTKTPFDTGHVTALLPKKVGWNDSEYLASVPGVTPLGQSTSEWPYAFWIKAERNDSTFFYGTDTNSVIWAGAERIPRTGNDTGANSNAGYLMVKNGQSVYIGSLNGQWDMGIDSTGDGKEQFTVSIGTDGSVALHSISPDGAGFMSRMDIDSSLDNVFYSAPLNDPSQFNNSSITISPSMATSGGVIVYLMMNDDSRPQLGHQWARLFIHTQVYNAGRFINPNSGGIDIKASFQPAINKDGSAHLPYY